jgi:hypothetical protein
MIQCPISVVLRKDFRMEDRVSREAKLNAAKDIVNTYIRNAVVKNGESQRLELSVDEVCSMFRKVFDTIDETVPDTPRRVGLGI